MTCHQLRSITWFIVNISGRAHLTFGNKEVKPIKTNVIKNLSLSGSCIFSHNFSQMRGLDIDLEKYQDHFFKFYFVVACSAANQVLSDGNCLILRHIYGLD